MKIADAPKFSWRGVMLDEARHFCGKETVLKLLSKSLWTKKGFNCGNSSSLHKGCEPTRALIPYGA